MAGVNMLSSQNNDETFERDLKEMLDENDRTPVVGGMLSTQIGSDFEGSLIQQTDTKDQGMARSHTMPEPTTNIPLGLPTPQNPVPRTSQSSYSQSSVGAKMDSIKEWSVKTFLCTRQFIAERMGKSSRTMDADLEAQIESLRDMQRRYQTLLQLVRALTVQFQTIQHTHHRLSETFQDLAAKQPELNREFTYNADTQNAIHKNGDALAAALQFFTKTVNTLANHTMDDTITTIKNFESSRLEFDAYKAEFDALQASPPGAAKAAKTETARRKLEKYKTKYERLRDDVQVKMRFLDENKVKVMQKQLLLFHNAIAAYFSGNQAALQATMSQFSVKPPGSDPPSFLEQ